MSDTPKSTQPDRDLEQAIRAHVSHSYGWHGGVGDPPDDDTVLAIIRGTLEFLHTPR